MWASSKSSSIELKVEAPTAAPVPAKNSSRRFMAGMGGGELSVGEMGDNEEGDVADEESEEVEENEEWYRW